jgi:nickel/cobalt transporter (NicO) family protein
MLLSVIHASLPNHWLTLVMLARAEKWSPREAFFITAIAGITHTISTVLIGLAVGLVGWKLSQTGALYTHIVAPAILGVIGLFYIVFDLSGRGGHRHCCHDGEGDKRHDHHGHLHPDHRKELKTKTAVIGSLLVAMFFSPCLEIEAYYFTVARYGWAGILSVSAIYVFLTVAGMVLLVQLGLKGMKMLQWDFLEHHERLIAGLVLLATGVLVAFVDL